MEGVAASFNNDCANLQPVLRLRGGGADAKRKEARKRKFAHLPIQESNDDEAAETAIREQDAESTVKKQKRKSKDDPEWPKPAAGAQELVEEQSSAQVPETKASEKSQRFIVFIGMY